MRRLLLLLTLLPLSSCSSVNVEGEQLICILGCIHTRVKADKKPAEAAGSNTKSTEDFSDPQKDQAPKANAD